MKNKIFNIILLILVVIEIYYLHNLYPASAEIDILFLTLLFAFGLTLGVLVMSILQGKVSLSAKAYKRELEKESISNLESTSQIKVLEQKIIVLEKALDQALNK